MVIGSFLENGFESTLSSKTNVLNVWRENFSVICKLLGGEVETIFWESEAKHQRLFKSSFGHRKLLRKRFWSYLELKNQYCGHLKIAFFIFSQVFNWRSWNYFLGKWIKMFQFFKSKFGHRKVLRKWFLKLPWAQKRMFWVFEKDIFQFFWKFLSYKVEAVFRERFSYAAKTFCIKSALFGAF